MSVSKKTTAINKKQFIEAFLENQGQVVQTCIQLKLGLTTFYRWKREDPEFKKVIDEGEKVLVDVAEQALFNNIFAQKEASIFFFLKKKGKEKGYAEASPLDFVNLEGWREAKTAQDRLNIINKGLEDAKISPAQAHALSSHVLNDINIENKIDELTKDVALIKKILAGGDHASGN